MHATGPVKAFKTTLDRLLSVAEAHLSSLNYKFSIGITLAIPNPRGNLSFTHDNLINFESLPLKKMPAPFSEIGNHFGRAKTRTYLIKL